MITCGECGAGITAENKTKRQKNGNIHYYTYYHCTKRINPNFSQKTTRDTVLEKHIIEILDKIEIPPSFHTWQAKYHVCVFLIYVMRERTCNFSSLAFINVNISFWLIYSFLIPTEKLSI